MDLVPAGVGREVVIKAMPMTRLGWSIMSDIPWSGNGWSDDDIHAAL
ncbi:hypothetical protein OAL64_00115 [bacterium]|nr:hypothetical protein [bacterium]